MKKLVDVRLELTERGVIKASIIGKTVDQQAAAHRLLAAVTPEIRNLNDAILRLKQ
jgi:hypothetical protein